MRLKFYFILLTFLIVACNSVDKKQSVISPEILKEKIISYEDSIVSLQKQQKDVPQRLNDSLIKSLIVFYQNFPKDKSAGKCLDKIQMFYSGNGFYMLAVKYADTLISNFPKYENRAMVIEGQAINFDMFVNPRDTNKVKKYFQLLLRENPTMDKVKKEGVELRLKHLNLTFDQFVEFQASNLKGKK